MTPKSPSSPPVSVKFSESRSPTAQPKPPSLLGGGVPGSEAGIQEGRRGPRQEPGLPGGPCSLSKSPSSEEEDLFWRGLSLGETLGLTVCACVLAPLRGHICMHDMLVTDPRVYIGVCKYTSCVSGCTTLPAMSEFEAGAASILTGCSYASGCKWGLMVCGRGTAPPLDAQGSQPPRSLEPSVLSALLSQNAPSFWPWPTSLRGPC